MKALLINNNRGMALLITLLIVSLIMALTIQFNRSMRSDLYAATNMKDSLKLNYVAKSGINIARALLEYDGGENNIDTLHELWANNSLWAQFSESLFDEGSLATSVIDHSGRIQLNALLKRQADGKQVLNDEQAGLLKRLLTSEDLGLSQEDAEQIIDAVADWMDSDDETRGFGGAENSYYMSLEKPYGCKNGPIEFADELLMVKGFSRELLFGTEGISGIINYLTPYGNDGRINLNTADEVVLKALSEQLDQRAVDAVIAYRGDWQNDLSSSSWYKEAPGFPGDVSISPSLLTTKSVFFEIVSSGKMEPMIRTIRSTVKREEDNKTELVSWQIE